MASLWVCVMLLALRSVLSERMSWGDNPDLVDQSNPGQGQDHVKLLVLMVGESIDLECKVAFTSQPVSDVTWEIDGKPVAQHEKQTEEIIEGKLFVKAHLKRNITEKMDGIKVSCGYAKDDFSETVEAVFNVFHLQIEVSRGVCDSCTGKVEVGFKQGSRSIAEANVKEKIESKIEEITKQKPKPTSTVKLEYSVSQPFAEVKANQQLMNLRPKINIEGIESSFDQCQCKPDEPDDEVVEPWPWYYWLGIVILILSSCVVAIWAIWKKTNICNTVKTEIEDKATTLDLL